MDIQPKLSDALIGELRSRWFTPEGKDSLREFLMKLRNEPLEWKQDFHAPRAIRSTADYPDLLTDLRGIELRGVALRGAQLPYVDLSYAVIEKCDLADVCLQGSKLSYARFSGCDMKRSDLLQVMADHSRFEGCSLHEAVLGNGDFRKSSFLDVQMPQAILDSADIRDAKMQRVGLKGARMHFTRFPDGFNPKKTPRGLGPDADPSPKS